MPTAGVPGAQAKGLIDLLKQQFPHKENENNSLLTEG